jgi:phosphate:Na+ symporter
MTFQQSLAVTLGSELVSTFLVQLFAFPKITKLSFLFVAIGFIMYLLVSGKRKKSAANTILGFGFLFVGMEIMSQALEPLKEFRPFLNAMHMSEPI